MNYITSAEWIGREIGWKEGLEKGRIQGLQQALWYSIIETLTLRFSSISESLQQQIQEHPSIDELNRLFHSALTAGWLQEFEASL